MTDASNETQSPSKTKTSFYRRLYVALLIDSGVNTVPKITDKSNMPRRTAQDTIANLKELDIQCEFVGGTKNGTYVIHCWGPISKQWVEGNRAHIAETLQYPID